MRQRGHFRQGVHDLVRRCNKTLEEYEEKLHLVQRFVQIRENVNEIRKLTDPSGDTPERRCDAADCSNCIGYIRGALSMAFESLTEKTPECFKKSQKQGPPDRGGCKDCAEGSKMALLEADVSFKVVKQFIKSVQEQAVGQDVMNGLNPGQMVIKIVNDELVKLMGSETTEIALRPASEVTIIMMAGLQGAGKTTTTAKIAGKLKAKGRKTLLAACRRLSPGSDQTAAGQRRKAGCGSVRYGR